MNCVFFMRIENYIERTLICKTNFRLKCPFEFSNFSSLAETNSNKLINFFLLFKIIELQRLQLLQTWTRMRVCHWLRHHPLQLIQHSSTFPLFQFAGHKIIILHPRQCFIKIWSMHRQWLNQQLGRWCILGQMARVVWSIHISHSISLKNSNASNV